MKVIRETAKAKINLDLRVCHRREDGYHDLDSLVVFTDLGDRLSFAEAGELTLTIKGPFAGNLSQEQDNLALRAARLLASSLKRSPDVHITLEKRLPVASGIGGGSADAAATLRGLVKFWDLPLTINDLNAFAPDLGADVTACLGSRPTIMTGIGDRVRPFDLPEPLPILLVNPGVPVETPAVFKQLQHMSGARSDAPWPSNVDTFLQNLGESVNDLETPAKLATPIIDEVLAAISGQAGLHLARMSGSGATCFGLFRDPETLDQAKQNLIDTHPDWWVAESVCQ